MLAVQGFINAALFFALGLVPFFLMYGLWILAVLFAGAAALSTVAPVLGRIAMIAIWALLAVPTFPIFLSIFSHGLSLGLLVPAYVAAGLIGAFLLPAGDIPPPDGSTNPSA